MTAKVAPLWFLILAIIFVSCDAEAKEMFFGGCPPKKAVENFDAEAFEGLWYEIERYTPMLDIGATCTQSYYFDEGNGTLGVTTTYHKKNGKVKSIIGNAKQIGSDGLGKFTVVYEDLKLLPDTPLWILDTDYKSYSILWSCTDFALVNFQAVYFLAREREPGLELRALVNTKMDKNKIRRGLLEHTNQSNCEYSRKPARP